MTRGGVRKGAGRPKAKEEKRTGLLAVRIPPSRLAEAKQAARTIGLSFTDFVFSAVYEKTQEVHALPTDEKKRRRKIRALERKMFALLDQGKDDAAQKCDDAIAELEVDDDDV